MKKNNRVDTLKKTEGIHPIPQGQFMITREKLIGR